MSFIRWFRPTASLQSWNVKEWMECNIRQDWIIIKENSYDLPFHVPSKVFFLFFAFFNHVAPSKTLSNQSKSSWRSHWQNTKLLCQSFSLIMKVGPKNIYNSLNYLRMRFIQQSQNLGKAHHKTHLARGHSKPPWNFQGALQNREKLKQH